MFWKFWNEVMWLWLILLLRFSYASWRSAVIFKHAWLNSKLLVIDKLVVVVICWKTLRGYIYAIASHLYVHTMTYSVIIEGRGLMFTTYNFVFFKSHVLIHVQRFLIVLLITVCVYRLKTIISSYLCNSVVASWIKSRKKF